MRTFRPSGSKLFGLQVFHNKDNAEVKGTIFINGPDDAGVKLSVQLLFEFSICSIVVSSAAAWNGLRRKLNPSIVFEPWVSMSIRWPEVRRIFVLLDFSWMRLQSDLPSMPGKPRSEMTSEGLVLFLVSS